MSKSIKILQMVFIFILNISHTAILPHNPINILNNNEKY